MEVFLEISVIIMITTFVAGVMSLLRQPLIIGYIFAGILIGPTFLNLSLDSGETMSVFSHIGIALLLFTVGLNLNPKVIKEVGKVSLITGLGQVAFTSLIGYLIGISLGFSSLSSVYIAVALTFSSTIIIMKLLTDKGDTETLYGRISIGFLLVQDLVVVLALLIVSSLSDGFDLGSLMFGVFIKGLGLISVVLLIGFYLLPRIVKSVAKSQEFLLLFSISWCLALAALSYYLDFSIEIGALLAGVTLAMTPYHFEISSKMRPLRDFFIVLFFILLGSQMVFADIGQYYIPILLFSAFILIGNPLIVVIIMGLLGYTKKNGFMAGLTVAQISEFSLIFVALGVSVGHVQEEILSMVTVIGLITIAGSTYLILYSEQIYDRIANLLSVFEKKGEKVDAKSHHYEGTYDVILFGYNRIGQNLLNIFKKKRKKVLIIDYDPEVIENLEAQGIECRYGDADDSDLLDDLKLDTVKMITSVIPDTDTNLLLVSKAKQANKKVISVIVSDKVKDAVLLYDMGASYVLLPHQLSGHHLSDLVTKNGLRLNNFLKERAKHIKSLDIGDQLENGV